jgi:hypothetical protein
MRKAYTQRTLRTALLALLALCVSPGAFPQPSPFVHSASIIARCEELEQLADRFNRYRILLSDYSQRRMIYFERGLGWKSETGYGFFSENHELFFGQDFISLSELSQTGERQMQFAVNYKGDLHWAMYIETDGPRLRVGYRGQAPVHIVWQLEDGAEIESWDSSIRVRCAEEDLSYTFSYYRDEPVLRLSPALCSLIFYETTNPERANSLIFDFTGDFPYLLFSTILIDAVKQGVDLRDEKSLFHFAVHWFRRKVGLPDLIRDGKLERAALKHARYLVSNGVIRRMRSWDSEKIDTNLYLGLHEEDPAERGFTGKQPDDRAKHAGYDAPAGECATMSRYDVLSEAINWFHTIFHRRPFVDPQVVDYGHAHICSKSDPEDAAGIANWGYDTSVKIQGFTLYPCEGETNVPFAWSGMESPNPFPGNRGGLGPPITLSFTDPTYGSGRLTLIDDSGIPVPCLNSDVLLAKDRFTEIIPSRPLEPDATYTVRYEHDGKTFTSSFTTSPLNPAEAAINRLRDRLTASVEYRRPFDLVEAMRRNESKGELKLERIGPKVQLMDLKYGFSFTVPEGWTLGERDWQEVLLKKSSSTINLHIYRRGRDPKPETVRSRHEPNVQYEFLGARAAQNSCLQGYRAEYRWEYANRVIVYYLVFYDYALVIYGYGVTEEEMDSIFDSFRRT